MVEIKEHSIVYINGRSGVVVHIHKDAEAYEVEFVDNHTVETIKKEDINLHGR